MTGRNLTLTEELEKLEQSITLTLQEIDHNFSKAHRIVTSSIIPLVEQYGEHSKAVWEASKFWKQFFEASANVSLSGYEDQAGNDERDEESADISIDMTADLEEEEQTRASMADGGRCQGEESLLDDAELTGSTPRAPAAKTKDAGQDSSKPWRESPYESMKREMRGEENDTTVLEDQDSTVLFAQHTARLPEMSMTPRGLPPRGAKQDPLLHRMLDKTFRVQATPHKKNMSPAKRDNGKGKEERTETIQWQDSPMSSPEIAVPRLRSEAFMSPLKGGARARLMAATQAPRTPGVSVQTPAARKTRDVFAGEREAGGKTFEIDWESGGEDEDLYGGMSPPKTIQFALPPSKLLQTPAREASRRIVDDILLDAGADSSAYSPSMVKMNEDVLNDTF